MSYSIEQNVSELEVSIPIDGVSLSGDLAIPRAAKGLVLFAHGSGSSRFSPRNRAVARALQDAGFATLLLDLLTPAEEHEDHLTGVFRFDVHLLADRLLMATQWVRREPETRDFPIGYFGASTGAAAALLAAAHAAGIVRAIVSRGGRPDLAGSALARVLAPTLLIVGGHDTPVIDLNRAALAQLGVTGSLTIVPGATHLFEEAGTLERVATLARDWFQRHLADTASRIPAPASW
jgi:dienelactone hydrolase